MSRDLSTFPLSQHIRFKLLNCGFITSDDLKDFTPNGLAAETELTAKECLDVLDIVFNNITEDSKNKFLSSSALDILIDEKSKPSITTSCKDIDAILNGGIPPQKIVEICGCPGAGKTQLCMQLCVNVQIPKELGGVDSEALFIDTEGSFIAQRLFQIASGCLQQCNSKLQSGNSYFTIEKLLKGIHYCACKSYLELIAVTNVLDDFLAEHPKVSLIIIDSIAFHFRYGFDGSYTLRARLLNGIVQNLAKVVNDYKISVVLTNQMTTKINSDGSSQLVPALGESWGHACAIRMILSWTEDKRQAHLLKSPSMAEAKAKYTITKDGISDI